jgi:hypothetical protein
MFQLSRLSCDCRWKGLRPNAESTPKHEPAFVAALVPDNHRNRPGYLFGGDVKAGPVWRQIPVQVPATPDVTELERSGEASTHD